LQEIVVVAGRKGSSKKEIKEKLESLFDYDLSQKLEQIIPSYTFDSTCQGSVPQAIIAFLESKDFEDAIRNSISLGGDADTQACITGSLAEAYYKNIPDEIASFVKWRIENDLLAVLDQFNSIKK
jgi:ADP-ribosylglycohydrolase